MMNKICIALLGLLGILVTARAIPQETVQPDTSTEKLVATLRLLNTEERSYRNETGRFATREEMLTFLRTKGLLSQWPLSESPIDLENPKPYELTITTSSDGMHYQITLKQPSDMKDKNTWCRTAAFTDDAGMIFLGSVIGCEASSRQQ